MTIAPWAVAALLFAGFAHACWNAVLKSSGSRLMTITTIMAVGGICFVPFMILLPPPAPASWPFLAASVVLHCFYYAALIWAYRHGDLSSAYPVARGSAPVLVGLGAALFADQIPTSLAATGVVMASIGISMVAFEKGWPRGDKFKPFATAFLVSLTIGSYTVVDGIGLRRTPGALPYIAWLFVIDAIPLLVYVAVTKRSAYVDHLRRFWKLEAVGGILSALAYALVLYILAFSGMAQVSALRETSVLFAVAIGAFRLKEKFGVFRWTAALIVTAGVIVMQLGG